MSVAFSGEAPRPGSRAGRRAATPPQRSGPFLRLLPGAPPQAPEVGVLDPADAAEADAALAPAAREDALDVERCRRGQADAYAALYRRWFPRCRSAAARILGPGSAEADDIAQEALTVAWTRLDQLRDTASFGAWACRISRNLALDHAKRRRLDQQPLHDLADDHEALVEDTADPGRLVTGIERDRLVRQAAAGLAPRDAEVFEHVVDAGLTPAEVADALGVSDNHAYQILFRLRGRVQSGLRAALVWRQGRPRCEQLAGLLDGDAAGRSEFTPDVAATVTRHLRRCETCAADADRHASGTHLLSGFAAALAGRMPAWFTRHPAVDGSATSAGAEVAVRVVAGIGVATTITGGVLAVGGIPDHQGQSTPPRAAAVAASSAPPGRTAGGPRSRGGAVGASDGQGRTAPAVLAAAGCPSPSATTAAYGTVVVAARRPAAQPRPTKASKTPHGRAEHTDHGASDEAHGKAAAHGRGKGAPPSETAQAGDGASAQGKGGRGAGKGAKGGADGGCEPSGTVAASPTASAAPVTVVPVTTTPAVSATPTPTASPSVSATPTPSAAGRSKKTPPGREQEPKGRKAKAPGHRMQPAASPAPTSSTAS